MRKQTKIAALVSAAALLAIGASMTALADWAPENGVWVYRDRYGETQEGWYRYKPTGAWCYADENGEMVFNHIVGEGGVDDLSGNVYYVDSTGGRITDTWVGLPNEEDEEINGETPEMLYYYFGSNGRAYKATPDGTKGEDYDYVVKTGVYTTNAKTAKGVFLFDTNGRMVTGDVDATYTNTGAHYYCVTPDDMYGEIEVEETFNYEEGQGLTGWAKMVPDDDRDADPVWYYFDSNGKRAENATKYLSWKGASAYYHFGTDGIMSSDTYATKATLNGASENYRVYMDGTNGGVNGNGWQYNSGNDTWYYIVNVRDANNSLLVRGAIFNDDNLDMDKGGKMAAKQIGGKTFIFDNHGAMLTGVVEVKTDNIITGDWKGISTTTLVPGTYYFYEVANTGKRGELTTGKVTYDDGDGEEHTKFFASGTGAVENVIVDGYVYGKNGDLYTAVDGDRYTTYPATTINSYKSSKGSLGTPTPINSSEGFIVVDKNGRAVRNKTSIVIGEKTYEITEYVVTEKN